MTVIPLHPFSYTRCQTDEDCQRKRYLSREWGGTGLEPILAGWNLVFGNIMHKALEDFANAHVVTGKGQFDLDWVRKETFEQAILAKFDGIAAKAWAGLAVGLLLGFERSVWPGLISEYEVIETEKWIEYEPKSGFLFRARQDLLLRNKFDGHTAYVDYKTTSSTKPQWIKSWNKSIQLHSSMFAMRKTTSHLVERAIVIGLYKGYKDDKNNVQRSILNYGWCNREYAMSPQYSYTYTKAKGWELFSVADEFEDPMQWIANMPTPLLSEQFPMTGPIMARDDIAEVWFRQQLIREQEVSDAIQKLHTSTTLEEITLILDTHFKQNFSKCDPSFGYGCEFEPLCWIPHVQADPLSSGYFKRHESDIEAE